MTFCFIDDDQIRKRENRMAIQTFFLFLPFNEFYFHFQLDERVLEIFQLRSTLILFHLQRKEKQKKKIDSPLFLFASKFFTRLDLKIRFDFFQKPKSFLNPSKNKRIFLSNCIESDFANHHSAFSLQKKKQKIFSLRWIFLFELWFRRCRAFRSEIDQFDRESLSSFPLCEFCSLKTNLVEFFFTKQKRIYEPSPFDSIRDLNSTKRKSRLFLVFILSKIASRSLWFDVSIERVYLNVSSHISNRIIIVYRSIRLF